MKSMLNLTAVLAVAFVAGCAQMESSDAEDGFVRIEDEAKFREMVVGKKLMADTAVNVIAPDGTFAVQRTSDGAQIAGTWSWNEGYYCREVTSVADVAPDCMTVEMDGQTLRVTPNKGEGEAFTSTIEG